MILHRLLCLIITKVKKDNFLLDKRIPDSFLLGLIFSKGLMYLRGVIILQRVIMIGRNARVLAKANLKTGRSVSIDDGCVINALSQNGIQLGNNVSIQKRTIIECTGSLKFLGKGLIMGNNVGVGSNSFLGCAGGVVIGDDTIIGNYVSFHAENHNFSNPDVPIRAQGVSHQGINVGQGCWIGAKATILDGANIGDGCIIAAGALVTQGNYESNSIYGGVPAKFIKQRFSA